MTEEPQAPELIAFLARETFRQALVDLGRPDPFAKRVWRDADLVSGGLDATPAESVETNRLCSELRCVRQRWLPSSRLRGVYFQGVNESG